MYLSFEWLNDFLDLSEWSADKIADLMSRTGIEVEGVENFAKELSHLVVGEVKSLENMEDSDHLKIAQVKVNEEELFQIVCGAPNITLGAKVITALPGAVLPNDIKITHTKLRGVESNGMICSLQELGFSDSVVPKKYADGIYILPEDAIVGTDVIDYLKLDDPILELSITPNRADALSMRGSAYEIGAIISQKPQFKPYQTDSVTPTSTLLDAVSVQIADESLAQRYQLRLIEDIKVEESPIWLQMRLMKAGIRPINNVVDVTNYILLLFGQPLHAFDYDKLPDKAIQVAAAEDGQTFTTLDGVERKLSSKDVLIKSGNTPIALAGVMGGLDSEVTLKTKNVLLESAVFNPSNVRLTSKQFNLRSESSMRFEKGINHGTIDQAGLEATHLMADLANGVVIADVKEENHLDNNEVKVSIQLSSIFDKLGIQLTNSEIKVIFDRLGFEVEFTESTATITVPSRRWDIHIEADVLEEIARLYGYDNIPTTIPASASKPGHLTKGQRQIRKTRGIMEGFGLNQVISYVLTSETEASLLKSETHPFVKLKFPMSEDRSTLRQSMLPSMLEVAQFNKARKNMPLAFYEIGKVFFNQGNNVQPIENEKLTILVSGVKEANNWHKKQTNYDFYYLKGILDSYFTSMHLLDDITYKANKTISIMHPGRTADIYLGQEKIGLLGQIHPTIAKSHDLDKDTYFAEIDFDKVLNFERPQLIQTPIPKYPANSRDLAILTKVDIDYKVLSDLIVSNAGGHLKSIELFDLYTGENIEAGKKSLAFHLVFQDPNKTLTDEEVNKDFDNIIQVLKEQEGLEVR